MTDRTNPQQGKTGPARTAAGGRGGSDDDTVLSGINDPASGTAPRAATATGQAGSDHSSDRRPDHRPDQRPDQRTVLARINGEAEAEAGSGPAASAGTDPGESGAARTLAGKLRETAGAAREGAAELAAEAATSAREKAAEAARAGRDGAAGGLEAAARALADAAAENDMPGARAIGRLAQGAQVAADRVRDADFGALLGEVERLARRHPLLFASAAAATGFAVARMIGTPGKRRRGRGGPGGTA